jgi:hypothetical protein
VKKLSKAILIALGAMLALVVAVVFGVNLYIQSPGVQARIQEEISRALRVPLKITNTSVTPWSDLNINGITIPNGGTNLLEAAAFRARYRLWPVFTGRLVIYEMSVENPKIIWPQNADGKWTLPKADVAAKKSAAAAPAGAPATPEPAKPEPKDAAPQEAAPKKKSGFQVVVEGFEIRHGEVQLLDAAQQPVAIFTDVNMRYTSLTAERVEGVAEIGRLVWAGTFIFENVRTPFRYTPEELDLPQVTGTLGGGPLGGSFNVKLKAPKTPFVLGLKFDQVDVARLARDASWSEGQAAGRLGGTLDLHGSFPEFSRGEGEAHLTLQDGRFHEMSYFAMIGEALGIKQLSDLQLRDSSATARIADEKAFVENLTLDASELQLTAKGIARFDGKLQFAARLSAPTSLIKQLPGLVRDNFVAGENDTRYIDFNVTGKAGKPKTDLLDRIVGQKNVNQFDDFVSGLFGGRKKDADKAKDDAKKADKKKKKKDEPAREEVPAPAADAQ